MKIDGKASRDLKRFKASMKKRVKEAQRAAVEHVAEKVTEEVKSRIPDEGGWLDIYRDSIRFVERERGSLFVVEGVTDVDLTQVPAERTLALIDGADAAASYLSTLNPWPIDVIPAIKGGLNASTLTLQAASDSEVSTHRERHAGIVDDVVSSLSSRGYTVEQNERPVINGDIIADLVFLSKRLEYGLGGFPRSPHWRPAKQEASRHATNWIIDDKDTQDAMSDAFDD